MSERVVLDANVVIGWCFGRRLPGWSQELLGQVRAEGALAPEMLRVETRKVVGARARGGSLSAERVRWFGAFFEGLPIAYDAQGIETQYAAARALAGETGLTVKDAAYLELALRADAALATSDRALRKAAQAAGARLARE